MHERASLQNPTVADPSRTADEDEGEDERDDEMSEPTHMAKAEKNERRFRRTKLQQSYGHRCL